MYLFLLILTTLLPANTSRQEILIEHHRNAEAAMQKKEYEKAANFYKQLIEECKKKGSLNFYKEEIADTYLRLAEALIFLKEPLRAEEYLQELLTLHPRDVHHCKAEFFLAQCSHEKGDPATALQQLEAIKKKWSKAFYPNKSHIFEKTLQLTLDNHYDALWKKAKRAFQTSYYLEAKSLLSLLQAAIDQKVYPKATQNLLVQKRIEFFLAKTKLLLQYQENDQANNTLFLQAMSIKKMVDYHRTLALVQPKDQLQDGYSELGFLYKKNGNLSLAKEYFLKALLINETNNLAILVRLQLASLFLEEQDFLHAEQHLHKLASLPLQRALSEEVAFLQGKLYLYQNKKEKAEKAFHQALSLSKRHREEISLLTALCHIQEVSLEKLAFPEKKALLIAQALAFQKKYEALLDHIEHNPSFFEDRELQILVKSLAKPEQTLLKKESLNYSPSLFYPLNWIVQGISEKEPQDALCSLETAYSLLQKTKKKTDLFTKLYLQNFHDKIEQICLLQKEPLLYLFVLANNPMKKKIALAELLLFLEQDTPYKDHIHFMIGSLFLEFNDPKKAYDHFSLVTSDYPSSSLLSAAHFWAAECQENPATCLSHRKKVLSNSTHPLAPKAYFQQYTLSDYLTQETSAIAHLKKFSSIFPSSFLNVCSFYLLALADKEQKEKLYQKAINFYESLPSKIEGTLFFALSAKLQLAWFYFEKNELKHTFALCSSILKSLAEEKEALTFIESNGQCSLKDECRFLLARAYFQQEEFTCAQLILSPIIKEYESKGIYQGDLIARIWLLQAELLIQQKKQHLALEYFELAKNAAEYCSKKELSKFGGK